MSQVSARNSGIFEIGLVMINRLTKPPRKYDAIVCWSRLSKNMDDGIGGSRQEIEWHLSRCTPRWTDRNHGDTHAHSSYDGSPPWLMRSFHGAMQIMHNPQISSTGRCCPKEVGHRLLVSYVRRWKTGRAECIVHVNSGKHL